MFLDLRCSNVLKKLSLEQKLYQPNHFFLLQDLDDEAKFQVPVL